ncbi:DUF6531 domain-containing protein [Actinoplanes sp. NPDC049265]|uniref:DUF6531 domain-containing protein n=1 Tax=Actinoplanes sp. NPDC049265 TaxID=3363902 RepID=UPI0037167D44
MSDELNNFQFWLSGEQFPGTDEDKLWQLAQVHRTAAEEIGKILPLFVKAIDEIDDAVEGQANTAIVDALQEYTDDPGFIGLSSRYVNRLGDDMDNSATEVEYAKYMIIATLIELMIEFQIAVAMAVFFPGSLAAMAARFLIGRFKIWAWLARAIVAVVISQVAGIGMQVLMDLVVQAIQIREGHRAGFDQNKLLDSVAVGSLGGAVGLALGGVGGGAANLLKKALGKDFLGDRVGENLPYGSALNTAKEYAENAAHEMSTEVVTEILWAVSQGEEIDWGTGGSIHGAALSGLASGTVEFLGEKLGQRIRSGLDKNAGEGDGPSGGPGPEKAAPRDVADSTSKAGDLPPYTEPPAPTADDPPPYTEPPAPTADDPPPYTEPPTPTADDPEGQPAPGSLSGEPAESPPGPDSSGSSSLGPQSIPPPARSGPLTPGPGPDTPQPGQDGSRPDLAEPRQTPTGPEPPPGGLDPPGRTDGDTPGQSSDDPPGQSDGDTTPVDTNAPGEHVPDSGTNTADGHASGDNAAGTNSPSDSGATPELGGAGVVTPPADFTPPAVAPPAGVTPPAEVTRGPDGGWVANGAPLLAGPAPDGRAGLNLLSGDDLASIGGHPPQPVDGGLLVLGRGLSDSGDPGLAGTVLGPDGGPRLVRIGPEQVADMLGQHPGPAPITLVAPPQGQLPAEFPARLAAAADRDVLVRPTDVRGGTEAPSARVVAIGGRPWLRFTGGAPSPSTFTASPPGTTPPVPRPVSAPADDRRTVSSATRGSRPGDRAAAAVRPGVRPAVPARPGDRAAGPVRAVPVTGPVAVIASPAEVPVAAFAKSTAETPTAGDPIDVTTGRVIYPEIDAVLPGLVLERTHRSDYRWGHSFGRTWASTLDQRVVTGAECLWFLAADGSIATYPLPEGGAAVRPVLGSAGSLRRLADGRWELDGSDRLLLFEPSAQGGDAFLTDVLTAAGRWAVERDAAGTPWCVTSSSGVVVDLEAAGGRLTGIRVRAGDDEPVTVRRFEYDGRRHLVGIHNSAGEVTRLRYDEAGRITRWDDRNGEWYVYRYDDRGRCVSTDGNDGCLRYSFAYGDRVAVVTDSRGGVHRYELNEHLQVVSVVDPLGATTRTEWDAAHRLRSRTDPLGRVTRFDYDDRGRPVAVTHPDGSTTPPGRNEGRPAGVRAPGVPGRALEFDLDGLGRPRSARLPDGTATEFGWTAEGALAWLVGPGGSRQEWHYDGEGNLVESIDGMGRTTNVEYGPFDLPIAQVDEAGNRTEYAYDTELRLTAVTNPAGQVWRYAYDAAGRLREETDFDGRTQRYVRDAAGQLLARTDAAGTSTHYAYDALGRVIERRAGEVVTRFEYDADGRLSAAHSPDAVVRFERDEHGRVIAETINGRTVRTSYHAGLGAVESRTTPSGRHSRWTFDPTGRPVGLTAGNHMVSFRHDAAGRELSRTVNGVVALQQRFDTAGRLAAQEIGGRAGRGFTYDAADRVTAITDPLTGDRAFETDELGRIRAVTAGGAGSQRYDYDAAGNLVGAGTGRWDYDGTMLVRSDEATYSYDGKGRLTGRVDAAGEWSFAWDDEDRIVRATTPGGDRWRYRYDAFGRRIAKQRLAADDTLLEEVSFAWSGDLMVEQSHSGPGDPAVTSWDYRPDGSAPVAQSDGDQLRTVITDLIGTPTHLVEPDGALRWWSRGDLWGRTADPAGAGTPLRFPGQYFDAETGLHYNRFRYYDPATARYLSPDPLGLGGGTNPTAYVPDPLTAADPLGLTSCKKAGAGQASDPGDGFNLAEPGPADGDPTPTPQPSGPPTVAQLLGPDRPAELSRRFDSGAAPSVTATLTANPPVNISDVLAQLPAPAMPEADLSFLRDSQIYMQPSARVRVPADIQQAARYIRDEPVAPEEVWNRLANGSRALAAQVDRTLSMVSDQARADTAREFWESFAEAVQSPWADDPAEMDRQVQKYSQAVEEMKAAVQPDGLSNPLPSPLIVVSNQAPAIANLRDLLQFKMEIGHLLLAALNETRAGALRHHVATRAPAVLESIRVKREIRHVEKAYQRLGRAIQPSASSRPDSTLQKSLDNAFGAVVKFNKVVNHAQNRVRQAIEHEATAAVAAGEPTAAQQRAKRALGILNTLMSAVAAGTATEGLAFVPGTVTFAGSAINEVVQRAIERHRTSKFEGLNSKGEVIAGLDADPLLLEKVHIENYKRLFQVAMDAAGIAGAYSPAWQVTQPVILSVVNTFLDNRVKEAERRIESGQTVRFDETSWREMHDGLKDALKHPERWRHTVPKETWNSFRKEVKEKLTGVEVWGGTAESIAKKEFAQWGFIGAATSAMSRILVDNILAMIPPKPVHAVDGTTIRDMIGSLGQMPAQSTETPAPTPGDSRTLAPIPEGTRDTDQFNRPIVLHVPNKKPGGILWAAAEFHGTHVWGDFNPNTGVFTPKEPDPDAFVPDDVLAKRVLNADHYHDDDGHPVKVKYYQPFKDQNDFTYLMVREDDGGWEWLHAAKPAAGVTGHDGTDRTPDLAINVLKDWIQTAKFPWVPPTEVALKFDSGAEQPKTDAQLQEFATLFADQVNEHRKTKTQPPKINVEGGSRGSTGRRAVKGLVSGTRNLQVSDRQALETGQRRAAQTRQIITDLVDRELWEVATREGISRTELPAAKDLFGTVTSRGDDPNASVAPDHVKKLLDVGAEKHDPSALVWMDPAPDFQRQASFAGVNPAGVAEETSRMTTAADPIDVATGRMVMTESDLVLPGLTLERTYRSDYRWGRSFGPSWASTLDQRVIVDGDQVRLLAADGSVLTYRMPAEGAEALPVLGRALPLRRLTGGGWLLTDPGTDRVLLFTPAGRSESLLSDVTEGATRWSIDRDDTGTPTRLRSSTGAVVLVSSSAALIDELSLPGPDETRLPVARFGYDMGGELAEVINTSDRAERFTYAGGLLVRWDDRNGEWYTYTYDEAGRCIATDGKGGYLRYRFDYYQGLTVVTDSLGAQRRYELNDRFQVVAETGPLGETTRNEYDVAYRLLSSTDPLGRTTTREYDAAGRLAAIVRPDSSRSTIAYDRYGRPVSWAGFDGATRVREFGADGQVLAETGHELRPTGPGSPALVVRNAARQITSMMTDEGETRYRYDALGRVVAAETSRGTTEFGWSLEGQLVTRRNPDGSVEEYTYDSEGNLIAAVDRTGRRTYYEYGAFDLVTARIDEDGKRTSYEYDTELRLTAVTDPAGRTWRYRYDPNGRLIEELDPDGGTQRYGYDVAGQLVEHTRPDGEVTTYGYDLLGRVTERRTGTAVTRFEFDAAGRLIAADDADSQVRIERDATGRVVAETVNGLTVSTAYQEASGAVSARTRPSGAVTQWSYDDAGRPATLAADGHQVRFGYAGGLEISRSSDAGLDVEQVFDDLGRLAAQRIAGVTDRRYIYDEANRLAAVYDQVQGDREFGPDEPATDARYTLDQNGRPATRSDAAGEWQFTWNGQDQLTEVTTPGGDRWQYRYDALGRRIGKLRLGAKGATVEEFRFVWTGDLLVEQHHRVRGGKVVTTAWEYHPSAAHPVAQITDGTVYAVVTDDAGTPMDVVGLDGVATGAAPVVPVRAGGRYLDAETGLQYHRSGYYDPASSRPLAGHGRTALSVR